VSRVWEKSVRGVHMRREDRRVEKRTGKEERECKILTYNFVCLLFVVKI